MFYDTPAIKVNKLTKIYRLYEKPIHRLKEIITKRPAHRKFVALKDVSFSLHSGQALGIIGDNGAGKSTLLKILSKTLQPTSGTFSIEGKVASLLELGTGFHPEFTGIENIFFFGSLLGLEKKEIENRVDEIVQFSGLGEFVNYPIKTYSSGMYVRLAFSVATLLDPDILIIDEALSVGDQLFQKKCLAKMKEFKDRKKTMLFCTHDLYQITSFCDSVIWLHQGRVKMQGPPSDVVHEYQEFQKAKQEKNENISMDQDQASESFLFIHDLQAGLSKNNELHVSFNVSNRLDKEFKGHIGWALFTLDGTQIAFQTSKMLGNGPFSFGDKPRQIEITIKDINLTVGSYQIYVGIFDEEAFRPLLIKSVKEYLDTGLESLNSICFYSSTIKAP